MTDVNNATGRVQEPNNTGNGATGQNREQTYTYDQLQGILGNRLAEERAKYAGYEDYKAKAEKFDKLEEANKSELEKATEKAQKLEAELNTLKAEKATQEIRAKVSKDTGVPAELLTGADEESCKAQAEAIMKFKSPSYPTIKDGGEPANKPTGGDDTRDQFAEWFNGKI